MSDLVALARTALTFGTYDAVEPFQGALMDAIGGQETMDRVVETFARLISSGILYEEDLRDPDVKPRLVQWTDRGQGIRTAFIGGYAMDFRPAAGGGLVGSLSIGLRTQTSIPAKSSTEAARRVLDAAILDARETLRLLLAARAAEGEAS